MEIKLNKILLIDDSEATNFFNTMIVKKTNCVDEVLIARDGKEALDIIVSGNIPDILFLDVNMPVMNGWDFLENLKKYDIGSKKPIIVLMIGAEITIDEKRKAVEVFGVHEFSEKMLTVNKVLNIVDKHFNEEIVFV
ncbi:response regulator [Aquimarina addita]|uniref:Response regulator n=1 Tax=Aquimarina addita TaxID=870485 RepID=A0ABP6UPB6_9FLAO